MNIGKNKVEKEIDGLSGSGSIINDSQSNYTVTCNEHNENSYQIGRKYNIIKTLKKYD